jgi:hypothetical protein
MLKGACVVAPQLIDSIQESFQPAPKRSLELGWFETGAMELLIHRLIQQYSKMDISAKSPQSVQLPHAHDGLTV